MEENKLNTPPHSRNKHTDDLIDHYWGSISYVSSLIKASELKAGLILSFYGILLNFVYQNIRIVLAHFDNDTIIYVLLALWFTCAVVSIYYSIRCFMPRIESRYDRNIFFFGDVISKFGDIREFSKTFYEISLDEDQLFDQLGQQIFINAKIANLKFENVQKALKFLAIQ
ncbi:Pycsar system effector family protein, partial [Christiangramia aquimixticola]|uniref:Pycsar system effector family protein n=1 Tax=Christiangramia aquimixticola TaxID=1697558 RepID=UPI003AA87899